MDFVWLSGIAVILLFGLVVFFGAPYLPTRRRQIYAALDLLNLQPGQTMLDLGCGDGRVLKAAAGKGIKAIGYELNPLLALVARFNVRHYPKVVVIWGDFWRTRWPKVDGIFVFLRSGQMAKLHNKITQYSHKPVKLVSVGFELPGRPADAREQAVFRYDYK